MSEQSSTYIHTITEISKLVKQADESEIFVITGGSRGIGLAAVKLALEEGRTVIATATGPEGLSRIERLAKEHSGLLCIQLDVRDQASVQRFSSEVAEAVPRVDVLINNAGRMDPVDAFEAQSATGWQDVIATNVTGPFLVTKSLWGLLTQRSSFRIVQVTGGLGSMSGGMEGGGFPAYRVSKAAINAFTLMLARDAASSQAVITAFDPGWVATDLGGSDAPTSPDDAARNLLLLLERMKKDQGLSGKLVRDGDATTEW